MTEAENIETPDALPPVVIPEQSGNQIAFAMEMVSKTEQTYQNARLSLTNAVQAAALEVGLNIKAYELNAYFNQETKTFEFRQKQPDKKPDGLPGEIPPTAPATPELIN